MWVVRAAGATNVYEMQINIPRRPTDKQSMSSNNINCKLADEHSKHNQDRLNLK